MNPYAIPPLISAVLFFSIGVFTYFKSESRAKLPFVALCFLTVVWQLSWTVLFNVKSESLANSIIKFGYSGIIFIPLVYYHFILRFCGHSSRSIKLVYALGGLFLAIHLASHLYISGFYGYFWGYYPKAGPAHPFYLAFITISLFTALVILRKQWVTSKGDKLRHQQVRWVAFSFGLYYLAASDFLVNYGIEFYPFGVFFILTSLAIIAYAIVKHKLLEIDIVIKKTVFYSCLLGLLITPCLSVIYLAENYLDSSSKYVVYSLLLVLVGFVFPRIKIRAEHTLENLLFGGRVDYQTTFEQLSDALTHLQDLDVVLDKVVKTIAKAVDTKLFAIYLLDNSGEEFTLTAHYGDKQGYVDSLKMNTIEFGSKMTRHSSVEYFLTITRLDKNYTPIPMVYEDVLTGIILIGNWEETNLRDTKALMAMANQLAVAVNNSLQMEQIKTLNTQLEEKVNERTRALREAYDELKRSSQYKDQFFSRVSHELRTPLTNIMVPLHAVLDDSSEVLEENNLREKQSMLRNASILLKRINDILDIAKLKSGKIPLHIKRCSIAQIIDDVLIASKAAADMSGVHIYFKSAETQDLYLDRDKVEQIVMNLINNALKFTDTGRSIIVRMEEADNETKVIISDEGCGISSAEIKNIFQPFYQTESTTRGSQEGSGLGLAICHEFMELHHGNISVESQLGQGTTFTLSFRQGNAHFTDNELANGEQTSQESGNRALSAAKSSMLSYTRQLPGQYPVVDTINYSSTQNKRRVLVVEDNVDLANNIVRTLASEYLVKTASNGEQGLKAIASFSPDIVVSDVMMPVMDGITFCSNVKNNPQTQEIIVILLTAKTSIDSKVQGLSAGADYYLQKPFVPKELFAVVKSLLMKKDINKELVEKNRELEETKHKLQESIIATEEANKAKSQFLANMSHEIRTPLTAIIGFSEYLVEENMIAGSEKRALTSIYNSSLHLLDVVNDILDISKIESRRIELEYTEFSPQRVIDEVVDIVGERATRKGLQVRTEIQYPIPKHIKTDHTRLKQILINLSGNAVKFTESGTITVKLSYLIEENKIQYQITDTGIGMNKDDIEKIFKPFAQADSSTTRRYGGTGLGLTVSRELAELLGGTVKCDSEKGKGSTFTATVSTGCSEPLELIYDNTPEANSATHGYSGRRLLSGSVLIVDDVESIYQLVSVQLKLRGLTPVIAYNGQMAVELVEQQEFDLILMDIQMPVMDGLEATRKIRSTGYQKPIVILTANALHSERERCLQAGADDFITKPIDFVRFFEIVESYLTTPENTGGGAEISANLLPQSPQGLFQDNENFAPIWKMFYEGLPGSQAIINHAMSEKNWEVVGSEARKLKGLGGSFGHPELSEVAKKITDSIHNASYERLPDLVDALGRTITNIVTSNNKQKKVG